ncbi:MAG: DUF1572 family protein [Saprospiraceae bacterium]|nr:DUF1572 family protein [Saprospiraceae bacterium]
MNDFLDSVLKLFRYYKSLGESTMEQLQDHELHWKMNEESNSISVIVSHLSGNMLSRWTDFLNSDGEKTWRNRDLEFEEGTKSRAEIFESWNKGWDCLFEALQSIKPEDADKIVYIRNQVHTVVDAIHRQLAHYSYHVGQIVFIGKLLKGSNWNNLSIPKSESQQYNQVKFSKEKTKEHFTDGIINALKMK